MHNHTFYVGADGFTSKATKSLCGLFRSDEARDELASSNRAYTLNIFIVAT